MQVPTYESPQVAPQGLPSAPIQAFADNSQAEQLQRAIGNVGQWGVQQAETYAAVQQRKQQQLDASRLSTNVTLYRAQTEANLSDIADQIQGGKLSAEQVQPAFQQMQQNSRKQYSAGLAPGLLPQANGEFDAADILGAARAAHYADTSRRDELQSNAETQLKTYVDQAGQPQHDPHDLAERARAVYGDYLAAGVRPAAAQARIDDAVQSIYFQTGRSAILQNRGDVAGLDHVRSLLADPDGEYAATLTAPNRDALMAEAEQYSAQAQQQASAAQDLRDAAAARSLGAFRSAMVAGASIDAGTIRQFQAGTRGTAYAAAADDAVSTQTEIAKLPAMPLAEQLRQVQGLMAQHAGSPGAPDSPQPGTDDQAQYSRDAAHLQLLRAAVDHNIRQAQSDPLGYLERSSGQRFAPLDFQHPDVLAQQLAARATATDAANARDPMVAQGVLKPEDTAMLAAALKAQPDADHKVQFLQSLRGAAGDEATYRSMLPAFSAEPLVTQIADAANAKAVAPDGRSVASLMSVGADLLKPPDGSLPKFALQDKPDVPGQLRFDQDFQSAVGNAFAYNAPARQNAYQAVKALYAAYAQIDGSALSGFYDPKVFESARAAYFGASGPAHVNGADVFPPRGMDAATFKAALPYAIAPQMRQLHFNETDIRTALEHGMPTQVSDDGYRISVNNAQGQKDYLRDAGRKPIEFKIDPQWRFAAPLSVFANPHFREP